MINFTNIMALGKANSNSISHLGTKFKQLPIWQSLTKGQQACISTFFTEHNIFITGSAGVGKSFLISNLLGFLEQNNLTVAKTSSTGVSAFNIGGQTLHSWMGVGLGEEDVYSLVEKIKKSKKALSRITAVKILLIDEISMIKGEFLDKIDILLKYFKNSAEPFGGVKVVFVGDFLQLGAVFRPGDDKTYVFESRSWREANVKTCELTEIVRQDNSSKFAKLLNELRFGDTTNISILESRIGAKIPPGLNPVRIYCRNVDVDRVNKEKLAEVKEPSVIFRAKDEGLPHHIEHFNKNCPAAEIIELKKGVQVMLLANINTELGLVNGSIGVVMGFVDKSVEVKFKTGSVIIENNTWEIKEQETSLAGKIKYRVVATRSQIPLKVAYAISAHKSQGLTLDCAFVDMNEAFASGQCYLALSRVRDLDSLFIEDFCSSRVIVDKKCLQFYKNLKK